MRLVVLIICAVLMILPVWLFTAAGFAAVDSAPGSTIRKYAEKHPKAILNKHLSHTGVFFLIVLGVIIYAFISYTH